MAAIANLTVDHVHRARASFGNRVAETPLTRSNSLSALTGRDVWLKAECLQRTGSFKVRGALNVLSGLGGAPVVAASAGNHAQGVALAASWTGSPATVFMPEAAALPKVKATRDYGAEVVLVGATLAEAVTAAEEHAQRTGASLVHPYDDAGIIAGQGTVGLEMLDQLPGVGTVIIPTGGGGLLAGTAVAIKATRPEAVVIGVEIEAAPTYLASRRAGHPVAVAPGRTVADGINVTDPSTLVFDLLESHVDHLLTVTDPQTTSALVMVLERAKLMVEPAGVVGVAALLEGLVPPGVPEPIVVVLSGGNIDLLLLGKVVRHGLEASGRYADLRVWVPDQPGQLVAVLDLVAGHGGNVVHVDHHREGFGLPFGVVEIDISVETRDRAHAETITRALEPYRPSA